MGTSTRTNARSTGNEPTTSTEPTVETATADPSNFANAANPTGQPDASTGPVGDTEVIEGQEHVLGDDPRRVHVGYHDSLTGAPVDKDGNFTGDDRKGEGPVPAHRVVSDTWPTDREALDSPARREGNEAAPKLA